MSAQRRNETALPSWTDLTWEVDFKGFDANVLRTRGHDVESTDGQGRTQGMVGDLARALLYVGYLKVMVEKRGRIIRFLYRNARRC